MSGGGFTPAKTLPECETKSRMHTEVSQRSRVKDCCIGRHCLVRWKAKPDSGMFYKITTRLGPGTTLKGLFYEMQMVTE